VSVQLLESIFVALITIYVAWEIERSKPSPYPLGNGDTLMVRTMGYEFCPKYCEVDHFHIGHKRDYSCETGTCSHIIYEDRLN
jgi:hypothetical protein